MSALEIIVSFAGAMFLLVVSLLAWIGNRVHSRLDKLSDVVSIGFQGVNANLQTIDKDLRRELSNIDHRVTVLEERTAHRKNDGA